MDALEFKNWINGVDHTLKALASDGKHPAELITPQLWEKIVEKVNKVEKSNPPPFHSQPRVIGSPE